MAQDYKTMIDQLRAQTLDQIEVTPEEFMAFRAVWLDYPDREEIVGLAKRNGVISYVYRPVDAKD